MFYVYCGLLSYRTQQSIIIIQTVVYDINNIIKQAR